MKTCSKCGVEKDESGFLARRDRPGKLPGQCKQCTAIYAAQRLLDNPGENARKCSERYHNLSEAELETKRLQGREWRADNREAVLIREREIRAENPEPSRESKRAWKKRNARQARDSENRRRREKRQADAEYKLLTNLRCRLGGALRAAGARKSNRTVPLLGCPLGHLMAHFDFLFKPGMTWENHGPVWHIDHIKPCAAFDLLDPEQQKACFHWTNLQPLFAKDNLQKSDHYDVRPLEYVKPKLE